MVKKIIIYIIVIILIFSVGYISGIYTRSTDIKELEDRTNNLESKLTEETRRAEGITRELKTAGYIIRSSESRVEKLEDSNRKLVDRNRILEEENKRTLESVENLIAGFGEDQERILWLISEMDRFITKGREEN